MGTSVRKTSEKIKKLLRLFLMQLNKRTAIFNHHLF